MERIKQAIEKAKRLQTQQEAPDFSPLPPGEGQGEGTTSPPPPHSAISPAPHTAGTPTPTPIPPDQPLVEYQQTQVLKLDLAHLEKHRVVAFNKNNRESWVFDLLRTQVLRIMEEKGWRTLAITSPTPEAGKTVVAINLAMSIAHQPQKTAMLVDFDLRRPKVGAYLGVKLEKSLNEVLDGRADIAEALVNPGIPRLVVLPAQRPVANSAEVLSSGKVAALIQELRNRYESRIILFDLPPLLNTDDTIAVLPQIDCVLVVVGNGMSSKHDIEDSLRHLPEDKMVGVVLNKADVEKKAYYYEAAAG